ncbi:MAG: glycosyltransferase [Acidimicrobiales bacterium]
MGAVAHRYALYAGVWRGYDGEPFFFGLQRRLLASRRFGGPVSVYAPPDPARPHLVPFFSPSFSEAYWGAAGPGAARKVEEIAAADPGRPLRTVTVGRLTPNKNQHTVIRALGEVVRRGVDATLDVYGDGPCRDELTRLAADVGIAERVRFHGMVDHARVLEAFADADLHLLATRQEGFGKVLLEGMVHATVPIFSESPLAPEISGDGSRALVFATDDAAALADHVCSLVADPPRWAAMAAAARAYAGTQTLDRFADLVDAMLEERWGVPAAGAPRPQ